MPLQRIETLDEPRARTEAQGGLFDAQKAHLDDFRNMLIWGDNKLASDQRRRALPHEKKEAVSFAPVFQPLLGPIDDAAQAVLVAKLAQDVPTEATATAQKDSSTQICSR